MTIYISRIERMRARQESAFGTDGTGSMGSYFEVPFHEGTATLALNRPVQTPMHAQQRLGGYPIGVLLPKAATLTFTCNLETFTTKATSTVAATSHWLAEMFESALGGSHLMTGTVTTTVATTEVLPVSVVTTLRPGAAVGLNTGTGSALEIREIQSVSASNVTLKALTSNAAAAGATVYGATTVFAHTRMTGDDAVSMQFVIEGQNVEDRWLVRGGALESMTLNVAPGAIPTVTLAWMFADWDQADGSATAGDLTGAVLGASTYADTVTLVAADSEYRSHTVGTASLSGTLLEASTIEFRPNIAWVPVRTISGINTVYKFVRTHVAPVVTGRFVLPYEDQTWFTARDSRTMKSQWLQIGSSTTDGGLLISAPRTQITKVDRTDVDGVANTSVEWQSLLDTDVTAATNFEPMAESPLRFHFL